MQAPRFQPPLRLVSLLVAFLASQAAAESPLTDKDLAAARKIYVAKCAKCHQFYEPLNYQEVEWKTWMDKMNRKSKLKEKQAQLLNRYLDLYRAGGLPGKPEDKPRATR
ncbi:MAG: hypothetical protein JNK85_24795 [Verrucomicrobiales bacterium]|nr:hypothetical protein [Verrucomicrobiales bacterium]